MNMSLVPLVLYHRISSPHMFKENYGLHCVSYTTVEYLAMDGLLAFEILNYTHLSFPCPSVLPHIMANGLVMMWWMPSWLLGAGIICIWFILVINMSGLKLYRDGSRGEFLLLSSSPYHETPSLFILLVSAVQKYKLISYAWHMTSNFYLNMWIDLRA